MLLGVIPVLRGDKTLLAFFGRVVALEFGEELFYYLREGTTLVGDVSAEALIGIFEILPCPTVTRLGLC
jgi:hypothetical protein